MAKRGLANLPKEKVREIASKGGKASHGGGRPRKSRNGVSRARNLLSE